MLPIPLNEHGQQKRLDAPRKNEARRVDVSLTTVRRGEGAAETFGRDAHSRDHRRGEQRRGDRLHRQVRRLLPGRPCWHHPTRRVNRSMLEKNEKKTGGTPPLPLIYVYRARPLHSSAAHSAAQPTAVVPAPARTVGVPMTRRHAAEALLSYASLLNGSPRGTLGVEK